MKKSLAGGLIALAVLLVTFQNCQPPPHQDEINSSYRATGIVGKVDLNQESVLAVNFIIEENQAVTHAAGHQYNILQRVQLAVDLGTGKIKVTSDVNPGVTENYCLTDSLREELVNLLKSSQVCKSGSVQTGQVCGQALRAAYAELITSRESFELGSASDTCGSNAIDLCDTQADMLKGYIANLKSQYTSLACSN